MCRRAPTSGTLYIDHEHVKGWARLGPEARRSHVRGLLCFSDNRRFCAKGMTPERALAIAVYLESHICRSV